MRKSILWFFLASGLLEFCTFAAVYAETEFALFTGSGIAQYQDIQIPAHRDLNVRGDGTQMTDGSLSHMGVPIHISVEWQKGLDDSEDTWGWVTTASLTHMRAFGDIQDNDASSYVRVHTEALGERILARGPLRVRLGLGGRLQQSTFRNISIGHRVVFFSPISSVVLQRGVLSVRGSAGYSPWGQLQLTQGSRLWGENLNAEKIQVSKWNLALSLALGNQLSLHSYIQQEWFSAELQDINVYETKGFFLGSPPPRRHRITARTQEVGIGIRKTF